MIKIWAALILIAVTCSGRPLTLETNFVEEPEMGKIQCLSIRYGRETFNLVPPPAWRAECNTARQAISLISPDHTITLEVLFSTNIFLLLPADLRAVWQKILPELADAEVIEEFPVYSGDRHGSGAELSFVVQEHRMRCRVAAVPVAGGTICFVLRCGNVDLNPARQAFGGVLTSFRHHARTESPVEPASRD
jgi:hypothetical protein